MKLGLTVKEIDTLKSSKHRGRTISEFIIYLMYDKVPIEAFLAFGQDQKEERIESLYSKYKIEGDITSTYLLK